MAWLIGAVVVLLAAWFGINATDQELSAEARAMLNLPPLPASARDNGFVDLLVLGAPQDTPTYEAGVKRLEAFQNQRGAGVAAPPWGEYKPDPRLPRCEFGAASRDETRKLPCLEAAAVTPNLREVIDAHATLLRRHRAMRAQPRFYNPIKQQTPDDQYPAYRPMLDGQLLITLEAGLRFRAGDIDGALRELEGDVVLYRRMASEAADLLDKMIAVAALDRAALFAIELARHMPRGNGSYWRRLESLVRPPTPEEHDIASAFRRHTARSIAWMQTRRFVRLSDQMYGPLASDSGEYRERPWWDPVAPYLYRPHQSVNHFAATCRIYLAVAEAPGREFAKAAELARSKVLEISPGLLERLVFNPVGWNHPLLGCDLPPYVARMHARAGVQTLARLIVRLHAAGTTRPDAVEAALAGPLGHEHPDPFTGQPMHFDRKTNTIGFDVNTRYVSGTARPLHTHYRRMAVRL